MKAATKVLIPVLAIAVVLVLVLAAAFLGKTPPAAPPTREGSIPEGAVKMTPATDTLPPILHSSDWDAPVPLGSGVNTAGGEDSAFVLPDGNTLYFFFTPNVSIPAERQLLDGVTGIWVSSLQGGVWTNATRVVLQDPGKLALDGCEFVTPDGSEIWFCSAREGYSGMNLFTAHRSGGAWMGWQIVPQTLQDYQVGEMHITADGNRMFFHSPRAGGHGGLDIWTTDRVGGQWQTPVNLAAVNTADNEGWPFVAQNGTELWFTRTYLGSPGIFRSEFVAGNWTTPVLILSQFAGEPTLDDQGNLYFTHHFYRDSAMIEADIYVARHR